MSPSVDEYGSAALVHGVRPTLNGCGVVRRGLHRVTHIARELAVVLNSSHGVQPVERRTVTQVADGAPSSLGSPDQSKARWRNAAIWPRVTGEFGQNFVVVQPDAMPASRTRLMAISCVEVSSSVK